MKTRLPKKSKFIEPVLKEFKSGLQQLYGNRLHSLILFGSYARGNQHDESDIDLLVVLNTMESPYKEIDMMSNLTDQYFFENELFLNVIPTSVERFSTFHTPLYLNINKEGVSV